MNKNAVVTKRLGNKNEMEQIKLFDIPAPPQPARINSPKIRKSTHFAVIEKSNDVEAIWGVGRSRKAAMDDAVKAFLDGWAVQYGIQDRRDLEEVLISGELIITRCTRRLAKEVHQFGGEIAFDYSPDKGADLPKYR